MGVKENVQKADNKIKTFWKERTLAQKIQIIALIVVTVAAIAAAVFFASRTEYSVLFTGMTAAETSQIYSELKNQEVDVKTRGDDTLLVPKDKVDDLRLTLINEGLPQTGYAYDIWLNNGTSFGQTDSDKKIIQGYQIEQDLAQTISAMDKVESALVKVVLPEESKFALASTPKQEAQASVTLTIKRGAELSSKEADTIRSLVEKTVPSLKRENITIADTNLKLYGDSVYDEFSTVGDRITLQQKMQEMLQKQVSNLLTPVYGEENFNVAVNVTMNFDDKTESSVKYEPPTDADNMGIIISQATENEFIEDANAAAGGNVGLDSNGGIGLYAAGADGNFDGSYYRTTNEFNAEVNEFKEELKRAKGVIDTLSVSIMINGEQTAEDGNQAMVTAMAKAIGVDEKNVSIMFTPFLYANQAKAEAEQLKLDEQAQKAPLFDQNTVLLLIGLAVLLIAIIIAVIVMLSASRRRRAQLLAEQEAAEAAAAAAAEEEEEQSDLDELPSDSNSSEVVQRIRRIVDKNPESVAQLLRNWLSDEYGK